MSFMTGYKKWLEDHIKRRTGERRDRLKRGHRHAEKLFLKNVWWPLFGHFNGIHPEYEVIDWRGMKFFVDFMWIIGDLRIAFEIKGYGPHVEKTDRTKYRRELNREMYLLGLGIIVVPIAYDELEQNPELIKSLVRNIIANYIGDPDSYTGFNHIEREIMKMALRSERIVRPIEVAHLLGIDRRTAVKYLKQLCKKGMFQEVCGSQGERIIRYRYTGSFFLKK